MKFPNPSILSLLFSIGARAAPAIQAAGAQQPPCAYPIGTNGGSNAKVAGRLFNIDGKVEYFAGKIFCKLVLTATDWNRFKRVVACTSE
jgi:mannan endo-1,4-beta-mannosidase